MASTIGLTSVIASVVAGHAPHGANIDKLPAQGLEAISVNNYGMPIINGSTTADAFPSMKFSAHAGQIDVGNNCPNAGGNCKAAEIA